MLVLEEIEDMILPRRLYDELVAHCLRKMAEDYLCDEVAERKAYGLLGAHVEGRVARLAHVFALRRNLRHDPAYQEEIDQFMLDFAVPSETVLRKRGWVTDPGEVYAAQRVCDGSGAELLASYHMHRVPWDEDPVRDTCTELDRQLGRDSNMWMFIVSMVDPSQPIIRAFWEGKNEHEARIRVQE